MELPNPSASWAGAAGAPAGRGPVAFGWLAGVLAESEEQPYLVASLHGVCVRLGGVTRRWRFDRMPTVCHPESGDLTASFAEVARYYGAWRTLPGGGLLKQIADALPSNSIALATTGAFTFQRLADAATDDKDRASYLGSQSNWLSQLGRREAALTAIEEAVTIRRDLAWALPAVFAPRLSSSLALMADLLGLMGREADAEQARTEAE